MPSVVLSCLPPVGAILGQEYRIVGTIRSHHDLFVLQAQSDWFDRPVAVHLWQVAREGLRFIEAAEAASSVPHPAFLPLLDTGRDPYWGFYVVYELGTGLSLRDLLYAEGEMSWAQCLFTVAGSLLSALAALHGEGLVHGDLSANDLLLAHDGTWRLAPGFPDRGEDDVVGAARILFEACVGVSRSASLLAKAKKEALIAALVARDMPVSAAEILVASLRGEASCTGLGAAELLHELTTASAASRSFPFQRHGALSGHDEVRAAAKGDAVTVSASTTSILVQYLRRLRKRIEGFLRGGAKRRWAVSSTYSTSLFH